MDRIKPADLIIHRKEYITKTAGNWRDAVRREMEQHYNSQTRSFSRSFVVGHLNDCCAASKGLADGYSWGTWSRARADLRLNRCYHDGRRKQVREKKSQARQCIEIYLRQLRDGLDGSKGASRGEGKTYVRKQSMEHRWEAYRTYRIRAKQPVLGSIRLFRTCWKAQLNLVEVSPTGQSICDECTAMDVVRDTFASRHDEVARAEMRALAVREELHKAEHLGERRYAEDREELAKIAPHKMTFLNMDAPTQDQLQIPVQPRKYRDPAKGLDDAPTWKSKMMGVQSPGDTRDML